MTKFLIIFTIILILVLIYFISFTKLKDIKTKLEFSLDNINNAIKKKIDLVNKINNEIKKKIDNKKYLKDYINLDKKNLTSIELDIKLDEALKLIKDITYDYKEVNTKDFKKLYKELKENDEELVSSKILYNKYAAISNNLIRKFPNNLVAKTINCKIRAFYNVPKKN